MSYKNGLGRCGLNYIPCIPFILHVLLLKGNRTEWMADRSSFVFQEENECESIRCCCFNCVAPKAHPYRNSRHSACFCCKAGRTVPQIWVLGKCQKAPPVPLARVCGPVVLIYRLNGFSWHGLLWATVVSKHL